MSSGWSLFVIALVVINIAGSLWLLWTTSRKSPDDASAAPGTTGHVWDGDLEELNSPLPRWWLWLFYGTVVFSLVYLVFYPGMGHWQGTLGWSQEGQWREEVAEVELASAPLFQRFEGLEFAQLVADEDAMQVASNLFANHCSTCHGADARGAKGFPNLTDNDWQYGSDTESIFATIAYGRQGAMPPWGEVLGRDGVEETIAYVLSLSGKQAPAAMAAAGKPKFEMFCSACHGMDGHGSTAVGGPNLADDIWVYGNSLETLRETISQGRNNAMPAHLGLMGENRVRLLTAYVTQLAPTAASGDGDTGQ